MPKTDNTHSSTACKNCGTPLNGRFCHTCGQEDRDLSVPFSTLLIDSLGDLFAFDSRLLRTLKPLLFRPGLLTTEFMTGRRVRYVPPFRLYLFISILMFVMLGISGHSFIRSGEETGEDKVTMSFGFGNQEPDEPGEEDASPEERKEEEKESIDPPAIGEESAESADWTDRLDQSLSTLLDDPEVFNRLYRERMAQSFFILLPIVALLLKGLYWRQRLPYLQHLIFAFHFHSFCFLLIAVTVAIGMALPGDASVSEVVPFWTLIYLVFSLKRVYGQTWTWSVLKTALLLIAYFPALLATILGALFFTALI